LKIRIGIWRDHDIDKVRNNMIDLDAANISDEAIYYYLHNELAEEIKNLVLEDALRDNIGHEIM